jgi:predicted  nucleic acid-binding Zn-ribbon protein
MNERIEVLRRLQSIDTKLKRLEGDKLYRGYDVQKKQNQLQQKKAELSKLGEEIKTFQKNVNSKELDLKSTEAEINKLRLQMNQVKTNKEYSAIKNEIGGKEADKSVLEDEILGMMTKYEEMQQRYKSFEKEIEHEGAQLKDIQTHVETDLKVMENEINELKKKHDNYASMLDHDAIQQYNRLVSHKDAVAVVSVVNKVCQGCFMSITAQTLNQLMSGKALTFCHSCGRILYLDSGNEELEEDTK